MRFQEELTQYKILWSKNLVNVYLSIIFICMKRIADQLLLGARTQPNTQSIMLISQARCWKTLGKRFEMPIL